MAQAVILFGGFVVKASNLTNTLFNHRSGYLMGFVFRNKKYIYVYEGEFNAPKHPLAVGGYYPEKDFLDYLAKKISIKQISVLGLKRGEIPEATEGDIINSHILYMKYPYSDFCKFSHFTWTYHPKDNIIDQQGGIIFPDNQPEEITVELTEYALAFYSRHIGLVMSPDFIEDAIEGAYALALIALEINRIDRDIFPIFSQIPELADFVFNQNAEWFSGSIFTKPSLDDIRTYYDSVTRFYSSIYSNQILIKESLEGVKMFWLVSVLSINATAVISVEDKINLLKIAISSQMVSSRISSAEFFLKIVKSVSLVQGQIDDFLDQLVSTRNNFVSIQSSKKSTLFEAIYINVADNWAGFATFGLYNQPNYRTEFINSVYELWKKSKFNPYFESPTYTQPAGDLGFFPESYYMTSQGRQHYHPVNAPPVLIFQTVDGLLSSDSVKYKFELDYTKIVVSKVVKEEILDEHASSITRESLFGTYQIYQPVGVLGYKPNLDLSMPEENCIPLFMLYYAEDYKDLKTLYASLFLLRDTFLVYTSFGMFQSFSFVFEASELVDLSIAGRVVLTWRGIAGVGEIVEITAGQILAISTYIRATTTDQDIADFQDTLNAFLFVVTLTSAIENYQVQKQLVLAADKVISEQRALIAAGKEVNLAPSVIKVVESIAGNKALLNDLMHTKLSSLNVENISTRFTSFSEDVKYSFFRDFYNESGLAKWVKFNTGILDDQYKYVDNWLMFKQANRVEAVKLDFITVQSRVDALNGYYTDPVLENLISPLKYESRVEFFDSFPPTDELLQGFKNAPSKIAYWDNADAQLRKLLSDNDHFWLLCDFDANQIEVIQPALKQGVNQVKSYNVTNIFIDPAKEQIGIEWAGDGAKWSKGDVMEELSKKLLFNRIANYEDVYLSVDIAFYNANGDRISGRIQEIDGLRFDHNTGKIEEVISIKSTKGRHKITRDITKLISYFKNLPDDGEQLKIYMREVLNLKAEAMNNAVEAKIIYTSLISGEKIKVTPSIFRERIRDLGEYPSFKIHPETLGTTTPDLNRSIYHAIRKNL